MYKIGQHTYATQVARRLVAAFARDCAQPPDLVVDYFRYVEGLRQPDEVGCSYQLLLAVEHRWGVRRYHPDSTGTMVKSTHWYRATQHRRGRSSNIDPTYISDTESNDWSDVYGPGGLVHRDKVFFDEQGYVVAFDDEVIETSLPDAPDTDYAGNVVRAQWRFPKQDRIATDDSGAEISARPTLFFSGGLFYVETSVGLCVFNFQLDPVAIGVWRFYRSEIALRAALEPATSAKGTDLKVKLDRSTGEANTCYIAMQHPDDRRSRTLRFKLRSYSVGPYAHVRWAERNVDGWVTWDHNTTENQWLPAVGTTLERLSLTSDVDFGEILTPPDGEEYFTHDGARLYCAGIMRYMAMYWGFSMRVLDTVPSWQYTSGDFKLITGAAPAPQVLRINRGRAHAPFPRAETLPGLEDAEPPRMTREEQTNIVLTGFGRQQRVGARIIRVIPTWGMSQNTTGSNPTVEVD